MFFHRLTSSGSGLPPRLLVAAAYRARAQETNTMPPAPRSYSLLHSEPVQELREFASDRPDRTESPCSVDAGYRRVEMDFVNYTPDHQSIGNLGRYLELRTDLRTEHHSAWIRRVDTGLELLVAESVELDCGRNSGVTRAADDLNPFAGNTGGF